MVEEKNTAEAKATEEVKTTEEVKNGTSEGGEKEEKKHDVEYADSETKGVVSSRRQIGRKYTLMKW